MGTGDWEKQRGREQGEKELMTNTNYQLPITHYQMTNDKLISPQSYST
ncbi:MULTISPECIES: hypothetical protein [unclassified Tolypothrix]|nr:MULTISPECIES: hypothetical protein [unclassified Tolypothrix]UYD34691.1 hypothetical protein HG267_02250 [Tolypothrix sp. PCC 7601]